MPVVESKTLCGTANETTGQTGIEANKTFALQNFDKSIQRVMVVLVLRQGFCILFRLNLKFGSYSARSRNEILNLRNQGRSLPTYLSIGYSNACATTTDADPERAYIQGGSGLELMGLAILVRLRQFSLRGTSKGQKPADCFREVHFKYGS
jgi:hypothetical protein